MSITQCKSPDTEITQMRKIDVYISPLDCLLSLHKGKIGLLGAIKTMWCLLTISEGNRGLLIKKHGWNIFKPPDVCHFLYIYLFSCKRNGLSVCFPQVSKEGWARSSPYTAKYGEEPTRRMLVGGMLEPATKFRKL